MLYGTSHQFALECLRRLRRTHQNTNSALSITTHDLKIIALIVDDILRILSAKFHKIICLGHQVAFLHKGVFDKSQRIVEKGIGEMNVLVKVPLKTGTILHILASFTEPGSASHPLPRK